MQTLVVLPALSNPPTLDESATMMANVQKISNLNWREVLALQIIALAYSLNDGGGTDYRSDYPLLIQSTKSLFGNAWNIASAHFSPEARWQAVIDWSDAYTADNTISTDVQTLVGLMGELRQLPESTLLLITIFLRYKLSLL